MDVDQASEVLADLQYVFQTRHPIVPLTSSGTGALEAAVANSLASGSKAICLIAGRFGERWKNICKAFGVESVNVTVPYGNAVSPEQLARALAAGVDYVTTDQPDLALRLRAGRP